MKIWFLEGYIGAQRSLQRTCVAEFPFRVGRQHGLSLVLDAAGISRVHAEIQRAGDGLLLADLNSTNGTFVNRQPISGSGPIQSGDIIHFADQEFRLVSEVKTTGSNRKLTQQGIVDLPDNLPQGSRELQSLLLDSMVTALYQPIVHRGDHTIHAYEMLGRGRHPNLSESPLTLFRIAESLGLEIYLSELMRQVGVELAYAGAPQGCFFTNTHPHETRDPERLMKAMEQVRLAYPEFKLVLEIHEAAIADTKLMRDMKARMHAIDVRVAYDDFGAGQARLVELADAPPDYVKLDMSLMRDIELAAPNRQQMVRMLVNYAKETDVLVVAEGITSAGEAQFCDELAIDFLQGYRYGQPEALVHV